MEQSNQPNQSDFDNRLTSLNNELADVGDHVHKLITSFSSAAPQEQKRIYEESERCAGEVQEIYGLIRLELTQRFDHLIKEREELVGGEEVERLKYFKQSSLANLEQVMVPFRQCVKAIRETVASLPPDFWERDKT